MSDETTNTETTQAEETAVEVVKSPIEEVVDRWFVENFYNVGPDLSTPLFNRFNAAKEDLKKALLALSR